MSTRIDFEAVLNKAQLEAVMTLEGPLLVIAGAGSGKTRTLVYRTARLVEAGIEPESILLLTFTRKAAQEMLERAASLADPRCRFVSGGTFHSLANRVLRAHQDLLGFNRPFTIIDRSDMEEILQGLLHEMDSERSVLRFPKRSTLASMISKARNLDGRVGPVIEKEYPQFLHCAREIEALDDSYARYKASNQLMDYDDLIVSFRDLLAREEGLREEMGRTFKYIMVDEYQDTNGIQAQIVKWLASSHGNVMVVGDDCQSIYSFRGADFRNMFEFPSLFPGTRIIKLEENYRSTQPILSFTNRLMERTELKYTKCLFTRREGGERPLVVDARTEPEQARFVCRWIKEEVKDGGSLADFAVLFRAAFHSFELEAELARQGVPYEKYGGFKFLESAHIKDFLSYLRAGVNSGDVVAWMRILRLVKMIGQTRSKKIVEWLREEARPADEIDRWPEAGKSRDELAPLAKLMGHIRAMEREPAGAAKAVLEYYGPILEERFDDFPKRKKELEQIIVMAERYRSLGAFLDDLILDPPSSEADMDRRERKDFLTLSTVHSAKGLEWKTVFIIWATEGRFPTSKAYADPMMLEEERRLMYVACTRAKNRLIICYPGQESLPFWASQGDGEPKGGLSSFLAGMGEGVASFQSGSVIRRARYGVSEPSEGEKAGRPELRPGDRVRHPAFGAGVVARLFGRNKIEVLFKNAGRKLLQLEYTSLEKL
jgi:DNA helicase-2/ATP-dependent DNA helicase PcrA